MKGFTFLTTAFFFISCFFISAEIRNDMIYIGSNDSIPASPINIVDFDLKLLPPSSGVQFFKDGIVFLSNSKKYNRMSEKHLSFGQLSTYFANLNDSVIENSNVFIPAFNFSIPSEAISFSNDNKTMFYTRLDNKDKKEKLYLAGFKEDENIWNLPDQALNFCKENYIYSHPAISVDGKVLIFSSDLPGSTGKLDLFYCLLEDQNWSEPKKLENEINTEGMELFSFLDKENNLFFSSDKLPGFGGFDIYFAKYNGENWDKPVNLGKGINSEKDEISFKIEPVNGKHGFFTSKSLDNPSELKLKKIEMSDEYFKTGIDLSSLLTNLAILDGEPQISQKTVNIDLSENNIQEPVDSSFRNEILPFIGQDSISSDTILEAIEPQNAISQLIDSIPEPVVTENTIIEPEVDVIEKMETEKEIVSYRVQILSSSRSKPASIFSIDGIDYSSSEYFYKGAYRITLGDFSNKTDAVRLQTKCRQSGYSQAFVVVLVNNERSLDPKWFR